MRSKIEYICWLYDLPHIVRFFLSECFSLLMREDLIKSAVSFLSDPKVQSAPLAKKVSFLESKGMNSEEIEEAMSRVSGKAPSTPAAQTAVTAYPSQQPGAVVADTPPIPPRPKYDWRDIFIGAVLAGGVGYGIWVLAKVHINVNSAVASVLIE